MNDLVEFLLARIDEDEKVARNASVLPEGVRRVARTPQPPGPGWRAYDANGEEASMLVTTSADDPEAEPLGDWGWHGGPYDHDEPEAKKLAEIFGDKARSGIEMTPYEVHDGGACDEDEPTFGQYLVAEVPARCPHEVARHIAQWSPLRVLAECEAKRRIIEMHAFRDEHYTPDELRALAVSYSRHPDFREEWLA